MSNKRYVGDKIKMIIPAVNTWALFTDGDVQPVICWAVVTEEDGDDLYDWVKGMIRGELDEALMFPSDEVGGFVRYVYDEEERPKSAEKEGSNEC